MAEMFEQKTRDNGDKFYCLKDERPEWMQEIIYSAHESGDRLPNDETYEAVYDVLLDISGLDDDADLDDCTERVQEMELPCYTSDLTNWLNSHNGNTYYLTQALEEMGCTEGFQALECAYKIWIDEIGHSVVSGLNERAEELEMETV